jgi:PleD family two-component response regulator
VIECSPGQTISVSAGVAAFPGAARSDLVRLADEALYRAKASGKNQVRSHDQSAVVAAI